MLHIVMLSRQAARAARREQIAHKLSEGRARQRKQLDSFRGMS